MKVQSHELKLSDNDKEILRKMLEGAKPEDIERFFRVCERTGLDPITKQIYGRVQMRTHRENKGGRWVETKVPELVIITGIDGFRAIAERTGEYRGRTKPEWLWVDKGTTDGPKWHDWCAPARTNAGAPLDLPIAARVGVLREGFPEPVYGYAAFETFAQYVKDYGPDGKARGWKLSSFWDKGPEHQISKCAEAQALRAAFPMLLGNVYIDEEVRSEPEADDAGDEKTITEEAAPAPAAEAPKAPEAPADKPKRVKAAPKSAPAAPEAEKPAAETEAAPEAPQEPESPELDAPEFQEPGALDYAICAISHKDYKGKRLRELTLTQLRTLRDQWFENAKFKADIASTKEKTHEAAQMAMALAWAEGQEAIQAEPKKPIAEILGSK